MTLNFTPTLYEFVEAIQEFDTDGNAFKRIEDAANKTLDRCKQAHKEDEEYNNLDYEERNPWWTFLELDNGCLETSSPHRCLLAHAWGGGTMQAVVEMDRFTLIDPNNNKEIISHTHDQIISWFDYQDNEESAAVTVLIFIEQARERGLI